MTGLNVVNFTGSNLRDIPKCLRNIADEIEQNQYGDVTALALVMDADENFIAFGLGEADQLRCIGMLHMGLAALTGADE